jgi:hypothetical protein
MNENKFDKTEIHDRFMKLSEYTRWAIIGELLITIGIAVLTSSVIGFIAAICIVGGFFLGLNALIGVIIKHSS